MRFCLVCANVAATYDHYYTLVVLTTHCWLLSAPITCDLTDTGVRWTVDTGINSPTFITEHSFKLLWNVLAAVFTFWHICYPIALGQFFRVSISTRLSDSSLYSGNLLHAHQAATDSSGLHIFLWTSPFYCSSGLVINSYLVYTKLVSKT